MKYKIFLISLVFLPVILLSNIPDSAGHGLGTETMPPVIIDGVEATLEVASTTNPENGIRQITITLFETSSGKSISNVAFVVDLIKNNERLFVNNFDRDDGILVMNLIPSEDTDVQISNQETFASVFGFESDQFNLQGKIFENGGLYKFNVKILSINDYNSVLPEPVEYDLGISIPELTFYQINDDNFGMQELGVATYFDQIDEFSYNQNTKEVEFSFPFDWNQETIDQTSVIHEEIFIPKLFGDLLVSSFTASLNDIQLPESAINIDDFSDENRIVHIVVSQNELQGFFSDHQFDTNKIIIKIKPSRDNLPLSGVTENGQFKINIWWDTTKGTVTMSQVNLYFEVLDTFLSDRPIETTYKLKIFHNDRLLLSEPGKDKSFQSKGLENQNDGFSFLLNKGVELVLVKFEKMGGNDLATVQFPILVSKNTSPEQNYFIPDWVKNNAGWWANGDIPDSAFITGIEFLIKNEIIVVPTSEAQSGNESSIPEWIKTNAGWWADGDIDDKTFANGIEFLINVGIIVV